MKRKICACLGIVLLVFVFQSCSSKPEEGLLKRYFHALSLNDLTTLSTMAIEPADMDVETWEIVEVGEEVIEPVTLPDISSVEMDLKKQVEESVGITLDARDELDNAKFELENARTRAAKRAAQAKVDELQAKYDEIYEHHKNLQADYNEAKAAAAREEEIETFSLGAGEVPNIRDLKGDAHQKIVKVKIDGKSGVRYYNIHLRKYTVHDEARGMTLRGRWIIVLFEPLGE